MKKIRNDEEWKKVSKVMIGVWTSLETHLLWIYTYQKYHDGQDRKFHIDTIREYIEMLTTLSELLK